jgi:hypothetical protein
VCFDEGRKLRTAVFENTACAPESHDFGGAGECEELIHSIHISFICTDCNPFPRLFTIS